MMSGHQPIAEKNPTPMAAEQPAVSSPDLAYVELDAEAKRRQRARSLALAVALGVLAVLFYAATMVRLGGNVMNRAL